MEMNKWNGKAYTRSYYEILEKRRSLPVYAQKQEFLQCLMSNQTVILVGETGSGKTTQIPQFVLEAVHVDDAGKKTLASGWSGAHSLVELQPCLWQVVLLKRWMYLSVKK